MGSLTYDYFYKNKTSILKLFFFFSPTVDMTANESVKAGLHRKLAIKSRKTYFNIHPIINLTRHNFDIQSAWT